MQLCYCCDCNSECILLQLHIILKILLKYIIHGAHLFGTFFPTRYFKRIWNHIYNSWDIAFFIFKSRKNSPACKLLVGAFVGWRGLPWFVGFIVILLMGADWCFDRVCASVIENAPCCILASSLGAGPIKFNDIQLNTHYFRTKNLYT